MTLRFGKIGIQTSARVSLSFVIAWVYATMSIVLAVGPDEIFDGIDAGQRMPREKARCQHRGRLSGDERVVLNHLSIRLTTRRYRLLCLVYTVAHNHDRAQNIAATWGTDCHRTVFMSNQTDPKLNGSMALGHPGPEKYNNMWQKIRSIWEWAYEHALEDYEWFHISGDDTLLIVDNLQRYLGTLPDTDTKAYFLGRRFRFRGNVFNSGASYVLNRRALAAWHPYQNKPACSPAKVTSQEDVMMAACLNAVGVQPYDTRDEAGAERFHYHNPETMYKLSATSRKRTWVHRRSIDLKTGLAGISPESIAFHYLPANASYVFECFRADISTVVKRVNRTR